MVQQRRQIPIPLLGTLEGIEPAISRARKPLEVDGLAWISVEPEHVRRGLARLARPGRIRERLIGRALARSARLGKPIVPEAAGSRQGRRTRS